MVLKIVHMTQLWHRGCMCLAAKSCVCMFFYFCILKWDLNAGAMNQFYVKLAVFVGLGKCLCLVYICLLLIHIQGIVHSELWTMCHSECVFFLHLTRVCFVCTLACRSLAVLHSYGSPGLSLWVQPGVCGWIHPHSFSQPYLIPIFFSEPVSSADESSIVWRTLADARHWK